MTAIAKGVSAAAPAAFGGAATGSHALHPVAALLVSIGSFAFFVACPDLRRVGVFMVALLILECLVGMGRALLLSGLFFLPAGIVMALTMSWVCGDPGSGWSMLLRLSALWLSGTPLLVVPEMSFVRFLAQVHAPRVLGLCLLITLRFTHVIFHQIARVHAAWRTLERGGAHRVGVLRMAVPLMSRVLDVSDCLSNSLEMRCFTVDARQPSSVYRPVTPTMRDAVFVGAATASMVGALMCPMPW
ncbi:MAG: energy-coupling factor transporter transmembrane component T [Bifidobacterium sp.]|jgi:energy-coupling factor transporter transmembrane protein EcfT